jgi:hypothetical protein
MEDCLSAGFDWSSCDGFIGLEASMTEKEVEIMAFLCDDVDQYMNSRFREALDKYEKHLVINVMINVATTTLSKVLLMTRQESRLEVMQTAISITHDKVKDGDAMIRELLRLQPTAGSDTCYPDINKRH